MPVTRCQRQSCTGDNAKVIFTGTRKAFHPDTVTNGSGEGKHFSMAEEFIVDADHVMAVLLASMHRADKDRSPGGTECLIPVQHRIIRPGLAVTDGWS
jgi:hypothetical protein